MLIETSRLLIREFKPDDAIFLRTLMNTPEWLRFIGERNIHSDDDAITHIESNLAPSYTKHGFGFWCVIEKETGVPVGMNGLIKRDNLEDVDHGFAFLPEYTGLGYAYESSKSILNFARDVLEIKKLIAITDQDNTRSQTLLEKLEFTRIGMVTVKAEWGESLLYEKFLGK
jgi:RimJ/RimL family protein N-acetyltransferase